MAWSFSTGNAPATGSVAMYQLLTLLLSAGWTKTKDSDGTTYSSGGTQVTSGASGANGLGNTNAWFVIKHPSADNAFCFQRGSSNSAWRISYCADNAFTGGSPSGSQIPVPGGTGVEVILLGGGSAASPSFGNFFTTDNTYKFHAIAGGAAEGYSFVSCANTTSSTTLNGGTIVFDRMLSGTFSASDTDPYIVYVPGVTSVPFGNFHGSNAVKGWFGAKTDITNNRTFAATSYGGVLGAGTALGANPFTSKDDLVPVPWMRSGSNPGWKGMSTLFKWPSVLRTNFDTYDVSGTKDYININNMALPWDGSTPGI